VQESSGKVDKTRKNRKEVAPTEVADGVVRKTEKVMLAGGGSVLSLCFVNIDNQWIDVKNVGPILDFQRPIWGSI